MNEIIMTQPQLIKNYKHKLFPFFAHFCLNNWICGQSHSFLANVIFGFNPLFFKYHISNICFNLFPNIRNTIKHKYTMK